MHHPIFRGKPVNHDPRERFIAEFMAQHGDYNVFHAFYRELVQALYEVGASRYVFCVNVDAVIAALLLAVLWKDYRSGALEREGPGDRGVQRVPLRPDDRRGGGDRRPPQSRPQHGHAHTAGALRLRRVAIAMAKMQYDRRAFTAGMASLLLCPASLDPAHGQQVERPSIKLGVANKAHLYYLPLTLAERRGHFKDYGLTITTSDFEGGGQSLEALLAGSVDVVTGAYEHTLHTQAKGHDIRAVIELGRFPGIVLAVGKDRPFKSHADLKGMKIGVTALSSSSHFFVLYLMAKAGLAPADATFVGVGGGPAAVDAMKAGDIDAISNLDPVITRLQQDGAIRIVTDSRFPRVNYEIFGGTNPAAVLYAKQEFIARTRTRCRRWSMPSTRR